MRKSKTRQRSSEKQMVPDKPNIICLAGLNQEQNVAAYTALWPRAAFLWFLLQLFRVPPLFQRSWSDQSEQPIEHPRIHIAF